VRNLNGQDSEGWAAFNPDGDLLWSTISPDEQEAKDKLLLVRRPALGRAELSDLRAKGYRVVIIRIVPEHSESRPAPPSSTPASKQEPRIDPDEVEPEPPAPELESKILHLELDPAKSQGPTLPACSDTKLNPQESVDEVLDE
jgi:hypothetical protein